MFTITFWVTHLALQKSNVESGQGEIRNRSNKRQWWEGKRLPKNWKWCHTYTNYDVTWCHTYINCDVIRLRLHLLPNSAIKLVPYQSKNSTCLFLRKFFISHEYHRLPYSYTKLSYLYTNFIASFLSPHGNLIKMALIQNVANIQGYNLL